MAQITTYFLEMMSPSDLKPKPPVNGFSIIDCEIKVPEFNRFLYTWVGENWHWHDKLSWTREEWSQWVHNPLFHTAAAYFRGTPAGYYEMLQDGKGQVEIASFGLAPPFVAKGLGGYLLTEALRAAWQLDNTWRVWLHTCSLDHPHALHNYLARGLRIYKEETHEST